MDDFDTPVSTPKVILYRDSKEDKAKQILMENLALERLLKNLRKVVEHNKDAAISNFIYDVERFIQNRKERIICDFGLDKAAELYRNVRESYREKNLYPSDLFSPLEGGYYKRFVTVAAVYLLNNESIIINDEKQAESMYVNYLRQVACLDFVISNLQLEEDLKKEIGQLKSEITYRLYLLANYLGYKKEDRDRLDAKYFDSYQNGEFDFHEAFANSYFCERAEALYEKVELLSHEEPEDSYESFGENVQGLLSKFERNIDSGVLEEQFKSDDETVSRSDKIKQLAVIVMIGQRIINLYGTDDILYIRLNKLYNDICRELLERYGLDYTEAKRNYEQEIRNINNNGGLTSKYAWSLSKGTESLYDKFLEEYEKRSERISDYIAKQPKSQTDTSQSTPKRVEVIAKRRVSEPISTPIKVPVRKIVSEPISTSNSGKETDRPAYQSRRLQLFQERVNLAKKQLKILEITERRLEREIEETKSDNHEFSKSRLPSLESRLDYTKEQIETLENYIKGYEEKYGISPVEESARKFRHR